MVVDDAIVVVENVERNMAKEHLPPKEATIKAMEEISTSLIAVVLVMASVFIPAAFLPGTTGQLYKQFAITIVISVALSGFVALTLTPGDVRGPAEAQHAPARRGTVLCLVQPQFDRFTMAFGDAVVLMIKRMAMAFVLLAVLIWALVHLFMTIPTSFVPNEDQGYVMAQLIMPDAASLNRTSQTASRVDELFAKNPAVANRTIINGYSLIDGQYKPNVATFFVTFKDFKERYSSKERASKENAEAVLQSGRCRSARHRDGPASSRSRRRQSRASAPRAALSSGSRTRGPGTRRACMTLTQQFLAKARTAARADRPEHHVPRRLAAVAGRCRPLEGGASRSAGSRMYTTPCRPSSARSRSASTTSTAASGMSSSSPMPPTARTPRDITKLYTRSSNGKMVPLSALVTTKYVTGPDLVPHFNGFPAAQITGSAAPGYSSGDAIKAMEEVANEVLPAGLWFRLVGHGLRGEEIGRDLGNRLRIRPHHRLPRAGRPVRVVDPARLRHDGGALRHPRRPDL